MAAADADAQVPPQAAEQAVAQALPPAAVRVAILTFDGFSEPDTFLVFGLVNRLRAEGWQAVIAAPTDRVTSRDGVTVTAQQPLEFALEAEAVVIGHTLYSRAVAETPEIVDRLRLDPTRQTIVGLGGGALLMARLGLMGEMPACADASLKPFLIENGVLVVDEPFHARGPVATAAGPLASLYAATWLIAQRGGEAVARRQLQGLAPVGEGGAWADRVMDAVQPFLNGKA
ncbi:AraC family transcriptional regulator [Aquabacterium sp. J223]|uniref:AraC family transcriptional regulator n=1 Tax=Aquabacterium sp. J223 TaxID=2898431 RepID=UPI0021ADC855|nr:AraC family transcriptional regulator [Aquabacterium sp. J223]UUX96242.1 AraC family transcriptional regulator [Aquabacterium sp. J223]